MENPELYAIYAYRLLALDAQSHRPVHVDERAPRSQAGHPAETVREAATGSPLPDSAARGALPLAGIVGAAARRDLSSADALAIARRTFDVRLHPRNGGWCQDGIQAAYLGLSDVASAVVVERVNAVYEKARLRDGAVEELTIDPPLVTRMSFSRRISTRRISSRTRGVSPARSPRRGDASPPRPRRGRRRASLGATRCESRAGAGTIYRMGRTSSRSSCRTLRRSRPSWPSRRSDRSLPRWNRSPKWSRIRRCR